MYMSMRLCISMQRCPWRPELELMAQFLSPVSSSFQPPVAPAPGIHRPLLSLASTGTCTHKHTHIYNAYLKKKKNFKKQQF